MTRAALIVALLLIVAAMSGAGSSAAEGSAVFVPFVAGWTATGDEWDEDGIGCESP